MVSIRPAGLEDLPGIATLAGLIWRTHYPEIIGCAQIEYMLVRMYDADVMRQELASGVTYDCLKVDDELGGFSSYSAIAAAEMKLHKLYVHPDCQRQGFGTLLLHRVEGAARSRGLTTVILGVNKQNKNAIAAYEKNGFTIREAIVVDIGGGFVMDDYVMAKTL